MISGCQIFQSKIDYYGITDSSYFLRFSLNDTTQIDCELFFLAFLFFCFFSLYGSNSMGTLSKLSKDDLDICLYE